MVGAVSPLIRSWKVRPWGRWYAKSAYCSTVRSGTVPPPGAATWTLLVIAPMIPGRLVDAIEWEICERIALMNSCCRAPRTKSLSVWR